MKVNMPANSEELAEFCADADKMKNVFGNPEALKEFNDAQVSIYMKKNGTELNQQIKEQTQIALAEMVGSGNKSPVDLTGQVNELGKPELVAANGKKVSTGHGAVYNSTSPGAALERAWGAKKEDAFRNAGEVCKAIWAQGSASGRAYPDSKELIRKLENVAELQNSFGTEVPADGGFLLPETMREDILQLSLQDAVVRPRATVLPMSTAKLSVPSVDETSHVSSLSGGITFYWTEESAALTESQAAFAKTQLDAKKLTGFFKVPNELLADAPAFGAWFDARVPSALAWWEDKYFTTGGGTGEPQGFINCTASIQVAAEVGQPTATVVVENLAKMYSRMLPSSVKNSVWVVSPDVIQQLLTMALSVGTGGAPVYLVNGGIQAAPNLSIYGRPVVVSEVAPALGTTGDISFVDLSYYLIGDRQMMQMSASEHFAFQNDQTAYRIIERVDGRPWINSALTPANNSSNTLTPFVQLASR